MIEAQWQIPASPRWVRRQVVGSCSERVEEIQPRKGTVAFGGKTEFVPLVMVESGCQTWGFLPIPLDWKVQTITRN